MAHKYETVTKDDRTLKIRVVRWTDKYDCVYHIAIVNKTILVDNKKCIYCVSHSSGGITPGFTANSFLIPFEDRLSRFKGEPVLFVDAPKYFQDFIFWNIP